LNNIASISSTPESNFENYIYEIPKGFAMANLISDSNIFYIPLSSIFALIGEQRLDFAKWKSDFSKDSNSSDADPLYIDPAKENLNIQNTAKGYAKDSPAIDSGVPVPVFDAYDGTPRPQGSRWDIGATEIPK
jgi:hypothetical protein